MSFYRVSFYHTNLTERYVLGFFLEIDWVASVSLKCELPGGAG